MTGGEGGGVVAVMNQGQVRATTCHSVAVQHAGPWEGIGLALSHAGGKVFKGVPVEFKRRPAGGVTAGEAATSLN